VTLKDYLERNKDKHENKVFYVTDEKQQAQYIKMFKDNNMEAVMMNTVIDTHFIQFMEMNNSGVKFLRIDADLSESMKDKENNVDENSQKEIQKPLKRCLKKVSIMTSSE